MKQLQSAKAAFRHLSKRKRKAANRKKQSEVNATVKEINKAKRGRNDLATLLCAAVAAVAVVAAEVAATACAQAGGAGCGSSVG